MNNQTIEKIKCLRSKLDYHSDNWLDSILRDVETCHQSTQMWRDMRTTLANYYGMESYEPQGISLEMLVEMSR